jgi:hypothetical protein
MGGVDRAIRFIVALVIGFLWYNGTISGVLATILGILALVFLGTSLIGWCPLYTLFGLSTKRPVSPSV